MAETPSTAQVVTLSNGGTAALSVSSISVTGDFSQTNNCGSSLAASAQCIISVTFTPTATGSRSGTLSVADNASGTPHMASLSGTGTAPAASLSPASLSFTSQLVKTPSTTQVVTLSNGGTAALSISSISATNDFSQTNNCGSSLAASAQCSVSVTFTATAAGNRSGTLSVADNASGTPHTASLSGTGTATTLRADGACTETASAVFPSCLTLSSPTSIARASTSLVQGGTAQIAPARAKVMARKDDVSLGNFQTSYAAQTAQITNLLAGTDPTPAQTLGTLGGAVQTAIASPFSGPSCFSPALWYSNHPDAGQGSGTPVALNGKIFPGDLGIWLAKDPATGQVCAAAELNALMGAVGTYTQFGLAMAAETTFLTGEDLPQTAGNSWDATRAWETLLDGSGVTLQSVTVARSADGSSYVYNAQFTLPQGDEGGSLAATITLTSSVVNQYSYAGVLYYSFDDGTNVTVGTTRYQRTSQTNLDLSARQTFYLHGVSPVLDSNGELDPGELGPTDNENEWTLRFSRFGASFDPTSPLLTGNYVYSRQLNAPGMFGPGTVTNYMTNIFQIVLNGDGTGSAFYGIGDTINQPDSWQIGYMYCLRNTAIDLPYAQYQPFQFDSTAGQFVPSTTIDAQIRYAPTSSCTYMDAEWKNGAAGGFWYDRNLQFENSQSQPTTPGPAIPEYVVADPTDSTYPFNLFGDGSALQPQINSLGFVQPTWF